MARTTRRKVATAEDVARGAGVSRATVSRVFNGAPGKFSFETEQRVREVAAELEYRPSVAGRALVNGRSDVVVVALTRSASGRLADEALAVIGEEVESLGMSMLTWSVGSRASRLDAIRSLSPAVIVDLLTLSQEERAILAQDGIPVVPSGESLGTPGVLGVDALIAGVQLDALSGRRIVFAGPAWLADSPSVQARYRALALGCEQREVPVPQMIAVEANASEASSTMGPILDEGPVGVACYNDLVAAAVVAAARAQGLTIPDEVAVVGVDAEPWGRFLQPELTSVEWDVKASVTLILPQMRAAIAGADLYVTPAAPSVRIAPGGTS